jgi:glycosyltransferase involved in cell wall biosynthesis
MKLAFIVQRLVYPPDAGTPIRNYNLIAQAARHHSVHVFGFGEPDKPPAPLRESGVIMHLLPAPPERTKGERLRQLIATREPDMAGRSRSPALEGLLARELVAFAPDVVQAQALDMAYTLQLARQLLPKVALVLDQHNAEYLLQKRAALVDLRRPERWPQAAYSLVQWRRLLRYERLACSLADIVIAVSAQDAEALRRISPRTRYAIVPSGVDLAYYRGVQPAPQFATEPGPHFVFPGKMDFRPNVDAAVWFAREVLPQVRGHLPNASFWVVGRQPHPEVLALTKHPGVHVTGEVPDARPYLAGATAVVVPVRMGGGTKLKVGEGAALARPLILTAIAAEGYQARPGRDYLLANTAREMVAACLRVAEDRALAESLGWNAFRNIAEPLAWERLGPCLDEVYEQALRR